MTTLLFSILMFLVLFVISALAIWSDDVVIHRNTRDDMLHGHG